MTFLRTGFVAGTLILAAAAPTLAQDLVVISPERETVIREYVQKKPLASIALPGVELNVGSTLPDTVVMERVDVPDVDYEYVVIDNRTVLVEPGTRRVIRVLD